MEEKSNMEKVTNSMEYPKLFDAKDLVDGVLRASRNNFKEVINEKTLAIYEKPHGSKSALDKVADDIKDVLGQLKGFSKVSTKPLKAIELKVEEKEYFNANEIEETEEDYLHRYNETRKPKVSKFSRCSIRIGNKKRFGIIPRPNSPSILNSNQIVKRGPAPKSKLQNFKHKIILSAESVVESTGKIMLQNKENTTKQNENLTDESLRDCVSPVLDMGKFINQSLKLTSSDDFPGLKQIVENKTKILGNESDSDEDWSTRSDTKKEGERNSKEEKEKELPEFRVVIKNYIPPSRGKRNLSSLINFPPAVLNKNHSNINKINFPQRNIERLKNSCNLGPKHIQNIIQGQSSIENFITHRKSLPTKNLVNTNSTSHKITSRNKPNMNRSNKYLPTKQNNNNKFQTTETKTLTNQMKKKNKTRSNSTLRSPNFSEDYKLSGKNAAALSKKYSALRNNSTTSSKCSEDRRSNSLFEEIKTRMFAVPKRTFSSVSSKLSKERSYSGRRISSNSSFLRAKSTLSSTHPHMNPMKQLRDEVHRAISNRKTFTVFGEFPAIRKALQSRGWVEKYDLTTSEKLEKQILLSSQKNLNKPRYSLQQKNLNDICKKLMQSKILVNHQVDLYWIGNKDAVEINADKVKLTKINKFSNDVFNYTSKEGFCKAAKNVLLHLPGLTNINHPRTYVLTSYRETENFIKDFRRTAAVSLLKWIKQSHEARDCEIVSSSGKIPLAAFHFAAEECYKIIMEADSEDIDKTLQQVSDNDWNQFLEYYYNILHIGHHFEGNSPETESYIVEKSSIIIEKLTELYPYIEIDGTLNIWILKPAEGDKEKGIHICRTLQYIMKTVEDNEYVKYIAQKYIERPLLIMNTKFDIRQWFLISSAVPLTIWMYKECYIRFSSHTHNLRKLHESIHRTNNLRQKRYQNNPQELALPNYNMWDLQQFKIYLSSIGFPKVFSEVTYKGMKECIIGAVLIHQNKIGRRRNSFQLFEADFMLTENFQPWLVEINANPALKPTTPVTSRMCSQVLEDTIKVVVDLAANPKAGTGNFELIHRQPGIGCKNESNMKGLKVLRKRSNDDSFSSDQDKKKNYEIRNKKSLPDVKSDIEEKGLKETLEGLLKFIQYEKKKHRKKNLITEGTDPIKVLDAERRSNSNKTRSFSFTNFKSNSDGFAGHGDISVAEEDKVLIANALAMLKKRNDSEIIRHIMLNIENILSESIPNKNNSC